MIIYGINPVLEALRAGRVRSLRYGGRHDARLLELVRLAEREHVAVRRVSASALERASSGRPHQGVVAELEEQATLGVADLLATGHPPLVVVLDGIEDPHNFGAILRSVDAAGADGVVRQTRRAAPLDGATAKASAGAVSHVKIADVVNIARALEELKRAGVWTVGLAADAQTSYEGADFTLPTALVVGAEGTGLRRLVRQHCDWLVSIPLKGRVQSLNASVAAGIVLFEAVRQRGLVSKGHE
jgi:23S rRNA (guanosine2251-2'-O)-methyltransferase